jgi:ABC-2 type transport system ATP-binding protein
VDNIISAQDLRKSFPARGKAGQVEAVRGVTIEVARGEIFGFLGPNGAGKTTTLRMLTTLLPIGSGTATVAGFDVARQPGHVRSRIGYVSQLGGADELATGRENLLLQGRLYGATRAQVAPRAQALVELLDLADFADRRVATLLGRAAATARYRARHRARAPGDLPRRADDRARPAEPGQSLGPHPRAPRTRYDGVSHHPLPGGG